MPLIFVFVFEPLGHAPGVDRSADGPAEDVNEPDGEVADHHASRSAASARANASRTQVVYRHLNALRARLCGRALSGPPANRSCKGRSASALAMRICSRRTSSLNLARSRSSNPHFGKHLLHEGGEGVVHEVTPELRDSLRHHADRDAPEVRGTVLHASASRSLTSLTAAPRQRR